MRKVILVALVIASCTLLVSCGGSAMSASSTSGGVPMSLTIGDTPPSNVAVLFFEALITGATLQPSDMTKPAVSVLSTPTEIEFGHLQTDTAFLSLTNVAPDTYASLTLTFGNAVLTAVNRSTTAIGGCAASSVCEIMPNISHMTATISSAPFPIEIDKNSVVGIRLDFNVDASVQPDLSINPTVTIKRLTQRHDPDEGMEMDEIDEIDGQVTSVGANQFMLVNERSGQTFTIMTDGNTVFEDFQRSGCSASPANISCVQMGQVLNVDLSESGMGTMLAKRVEFEEDANREAIKGTITSVDSTTATTVQFHMVVYNEEPALGGVTEGSLIAVTASNATFQVGSEEMGEDGGFNIAGLMFASGSDLMVGQNVQIRPGMASSSSGVTTITTDLVRLWPSQITGEVGSSGPSNGTFTLTNLSPLFTGATPPVTMINVVTLSNLNFEDFSGLGSLTPTSTVSVKGLLFNTPGTPTLVTRTMREEGGGGGSD
jgi:hypothetical protein